MAALHLYRPLVINRDGLALKCVDGERQPRSAGWSPATQRNAVSLAWLSRGLQHPPPPHPTPGLSAWAPRAVSVKEGTRGGRASTVERRAACLLHTGDLTSRGPGDGTAACAPLAPAGRHHCALDTHLPRPPLPSGSSARARAQGLPQPAAPQGRSSPRAPFFPGLGSQRDARGCV